MELSQAFLSNGETGMLMINNLINVSESTSEVQVIFGSFSSLEDNIVELEIFVFDGSWF